LLTLYLFSIFNTFADIDIQLRQGLSIYTERFVLVNTLLFTEAWKDRLPPQELPPRILLGSFALDSSITAMNTEDIYDYIFDEMMAKRDALAASVNAFKLNQLLKDAPKSLQVQVLKDRLTIEDHEGEQDIIISQQESSSVTFFSNLIVNFEVFADNVASLGVAMKGKKPPYNLPSDLLFNEFIDEVSTRFSTLRNSLSGMLDYNNASSSHSDCTSSSSGWLFTWDGR